MSQVDKLEYKILGYAASELSSEAAPFVIVVMCQIQGRANLARYVLSDWKSCFTGVSLGAQEVLQHFIDDLKSYEPGDETERFFVYLGTLGVGAVRLMKEGIGGIESMDSDIAEFMHGAPLRCKWPESFTRL